MASTNIYSLPFTLILYFFYTHHLAGLTGGCLSSADIYHLQLRQNARSKQGFRSSLLENSTSFVSTLQRLTSTFCRHTSVFHSALIRPSVAAPIHGTLRCCRFGHITPLVLWRSLILPDPNSYSPTISLSLCSKKPFFLSTRNCNERQNVTQNFGVKKFGQPRPLWAHMKVCCLVGRCVLTSNCAILC